MFVFNGLKSPNWLTVGFLNFILMFTFMFSDGTSVCNFHFISYSEEDISQLLLVVRSDNMAKYRWLSLSLHFRRLFVMVWIAVSIKSLLWENLGIEVVFMKSHDLQNVLNFRELYWGCIVTKYFLGYAMFCNILLIWVMTASDEIFGSWPSLKYLVV